MIEWRETTQDEITVPYHLSQDTNRNL